VSQDDQARAAAFLENFDDSVELYETHAAKQKLTLKSKRKYLPSLGLTEEGAESSAGDVGPLVFRPLDGSRLHLMSHASDRETDQAAADDDEPVTMLSGALPGAYKRRQMVRTAVVEDAPDGTSPSDGFEFKES